MSLATSKIAGGYDPLAAYDYHLPAGRIAQKPAPRRVQARMLILPKESEACWHQLVAHLTRWLRPGDLLVVNNTKVVPARLLGQKSTGGRVEILLLNPVHPVTLDEQGREIHQALARCHGSLKAGAMVVFSGQETAWAEIIERHERGKCLVRLSKPALELAGEVGQLPLPPYIKRPQGLNHEDEARYQTVYAGQPGAVAAPTAGLHLTKALLRALQKRGVSLAKLILHVGYGTFAEPAPQDLAAGRLHPEWVEIDEELVRAVNRTRSQSGRVVAVGTTSARALEWQAGPGGTIRPGKGWCDLLVGEGYKFKVVDGLLTNFHLPRTTLLMLVSALAGRDRVLAAYQKAIAKSYRFYSFGDAMLII